jgi:hypothetical protein
MSPRSLRSSYRSPNTVDAEAIKRHGFRDQGIVVVSVDDPRLAWPEREILKQIGAKLYGERKIAVA